MVVNKKQGISVGFNLDEARLKLEELKKIVAEKEALEKRGGVYAATEEEGAERRKLQRKQQGAKSKSKDKGDAAAFTHTSHWQIMKDKQQELDQKLKEEERQRKELEQQQKQNEQEQAKKQKELEQQLKQNEKEQAKKQKELDQKLKEEEKQRHQQNALIDKQNAQVQELAMNPFGAIKSRGLGFLQSILPVAAITSFATFIFDHIYARLEKEFGPGGRWDLRKLVLNQVFDLLDITKRIQRDRGDVYFASGHSSPVYQGAPGISNTESLVDGHLRDILIDPGR